MGLPSLVVLSTCTEQHMVEQKAKNMLHWISLSVCVNVLLKLSVLGDIRAKEMPNDAKCLLH